MGRGCRSTVTPSPVRVATLPGTSSTASGEGGDPAVWVAIEECVYSRRELDPQIIELARHQAGVISQRQLEALRCPPGAGRRWKRDWVPLGLGLHCVGDPTWLSWCWAGVLNAGVTGLVGGSAAAHLLGAVVEPPEQILVFHQRSSALKRLGDPEVGVTFRRSDRVGRGAPPRTRIETSLVDLAAEVTEDQTVAAVTRAFSQGLTTPSRVLALLATRQRVSQRRLLMELCHESSSGIESVLEWRFMKVVVRAHGLPEPARQQKLTAGTRSDVCWGGSTALLWNSMVGSATSRHSGTWPGTIGSQCRGCRRCGTGGTMSRADRAKWRGSWLRH